MKLATALALALLSPIALAQMGPSSQGQGGPGGPPQGGVRPSGAETGVTATVTAETETVRILALKAVQTDLGLKLDETNALGGVAQSLRRTASTEDAALSAVSKVLTTDQTSRLKELLVQDLGYNSLVLADVRSQLVLTTDQTTQIETLVSTLETAAVALAKSTDPAIAAKARTALLSKSSTDLAKVLTAEQDAKLRSLAGRALGAS